MNDSRPGFSHADGSVAEVFSSANRKTVMRHFRWMRDYGIDGAFVQRFATQLGTDRLHQNVNRVLSNVRAAAGDAGRAYAVMYDLSGLKSGQVSRVRDDWIQLRDELKVTDDPTYLRHNDRPLVAVWGIGFADDRDYSIEECFRLVTWLKSEGCSVMLGVPSFWREGRRDAANEALLKQTIELADVISPWSVGRYRTPDAARHHAMEVWKPDSDWLSAKGIDFLPVVFPGFSWQNLHGGKLGSIPRLKGDFFWSQVESAKQIGCQMLYIAMFDEVDEGTAIFKCTDDPPQNDKSRFLTLEGLPSDHYLKLAGRAGALIRKSVKPPNIVVLFIDDMGYADPSCFGNPAMKTPNIDRLAAEGLRLTNFYVNSPICSASRVALTTGRYPQRYRIHSYFATRASNRQRKMPNWLDPNAPTLAKLLKQQGYATAHFGKWHMGGGRDVGDAPLPQAYGFDESLVSFEGLGDRILWSKTGNQKLSWTHGRGEILSRPKHKTTETYVDRAIDFINQHRDRPFYLRVFPNDVHDAHIPSTQQRRKWDGASKNPPDVDFFAVLDEMDRQIGRLLDKLDELQLAENTLVLFTSDNGPTDWPRYYKAGHDPPGFTGPLFGRKWSLYEGGIRMPFIVRWPARIPAGATDDQTVMAAVDVLPTLASMVGVQNHLDGSDGLDMSQALLGKPISRPAPVYWEYGVHGSITPGKVEHVSPQLAMREGDWKLMLDPDGSNAKLFDLKSDVGEKNNVIEQQREIGGSMRKRLLAWWTEMNQYYQDAGVNDQRNENQ